MPTPPGVGCNITTLKPWGCGWGVILCFSHSNSALSTSCCAASAAILCSIHKALLIFYHLFFTILLHLCHFALFFFFFLTQLLSSPFSHLVLLCALSSGKAKSDPLLTTNKKSDAPTGLNSGGSTHPQHLPIPDQFTVFKNFSTLFHLWPSLRINTVSSLQLFKSLLLFPLHYLFFFFHHFFIPVTLSSFLESISRFLTVFFSFLTFLTLLFPIQSPTDVSALFSLFCLCPVHTIFFPSETSLSYSQSISFWHFFVPFSLFFLCPIHTGCFFVFLSEISSSYSQSVSFWHLSVPFSLFFFCPIHTVSFFKCLPYPQFVSFWHLSVAFSLFLFLSYSHSIFLKFLCPIHNLFLSGTCLSPSASSFVVAVVLLTPSFNASLSRVQFISFRCFFLPHFSLFLPSVTSLLYSRSCPPSPPHPLSF